MQEGHEIDVDPQTRQQHTPIQEPATVATERTQPLFKLNETFRTDTLASGEEEKVIERQLSPYEKAYTVKDHAYVVWTQGPNTGRVFQIIDEPTPDQKAHLPTTAEIQARIKQELQELDDLVKQYQALKVGDHLSSDANNAINKKKADLYLYLYRTYYGNEATVGLEHAQLFDLEGEGQNYYEFLSSMIPRTEAEAEQFQRQHGYDRYLEAQAEAEGFSLALEKLKEESKGLSNKKKTEALNEFFGCSNEKYFDPEKPIILTHNAFGHILPNVVQLGGLGAKEYFEAQGIRKLLGGEGNGTYSYTPSVVSFWFHEKGEVARMGGHGSGDAIFEYPIAFGIDEEHAKKLSVSFGSMTGEMTVKDYVPMDCISHLFVPAFKVDEVKEMLAAQGFSHLQVLAFDEPSPQSRSITTEAAAPAAENQLVEKIESIVPEIDSAVKQRFGVSLAAYRDNVLIDIIARRYRRDYDIELPRDPRSLMEVLRIAKDTLRG